MLVAPMVQDRMSEWHIMTRQPSHPRHFVQKYRKPFRPEFVIHSRCFLLWSVVDRWLSWWWVSRKLKDWTRFFLCHQKIAAGSMARLLKIELQKRGSKFTTFATWINLARHWRWNICTSTAWIISSWSVFFLVDSFWVLKRLRAQLREVLWGRDTIPGWLRWLERPHQAGAAEVTKIPPLRNIEDKSHILTQPCAVGLLFWQSKMRSSSSANLCYTFMDLIQSQVLVCRR